MSSPISKPNESKDNEEEEIIINLINDIFQYENKIQEVNNFLKSNNTTINKNQIKLSELKHQKLILSQKLENIQQNISEIIKNKDIQIKLKESMKNEIQNKIEEYKYKINTLNSLSFNPLLKEKIFPNNNLKNEILTNKQINDILTNAKNIKNISDEENKSIANEIINKNKNEEKDLIDNINDLKIKTNQLTELLKMIKEDKYSTNYELINIISSKESIDALIKFNHYLIKNYTKENSDKENLKKDEHINEEINNDEEIYNKNKWTSPATLFFYEISTLDSEQFSVGFNDIIVDIYDINNLTLNNKNNNSELSSVPAKKKINNNNLNNGVFSIAKILKKEFEFFVKINKNNALINHDGIMKNFLEKISNIIINKLKLFIGKKYNIEKFNEINKNVIIYLSYYVKSLYYEKIIVGNLKFINKEYKYNKKELQNINNNLIVEIKKLELKQKDLHQQIDNKEKELNLIQDKSLKNNLINNLKNENLSNLSNNEQEYIQLCSKINNLLLQKDEVNANCEKLNNESKTKKEELDLEENKIKQEISDINKEIKLLEEELEQKQIKSNQEIIEYRKIIADKYNQIKSQLKKCKNKYGENTEQYNYLLQNINEKIKSKEKLSLNDLDMIKYTANRKTDGNKNEINSNHVINSYEYDEKNNYNTKRKTNDKNYFNLEFSNNRFNKSNKSCKNKTPINIKLRRNKEKMINLYSSNKLQKHINYIEKYFNTNSNKDSNNEDRNSHLNLKSSSQLNFYPCLKSINYSCSHTDKKNYNNHQKIFNTPWPYHDNSTRITSLIDKYSKNIPFYAATQRNPINYFNSNRILYPYKNDKLSCNLDLNKYFSKNNNNDTKENELSKTINELKYNIMKNEKLSLKFLEKIKILTKITFCFFRKKNKKNAKFNPINKISNESLSNSPYNFIKSSISLNKTYNSIRIGLTTQLDPIDIYIKDIGYTIVSSSMKSMIEIYRDYKKFIKNGTENDKDSFIKIEMKKNNNLSSEYINRCIDNKKYCFTLFVEENQKMEFVFFSYDDFKTWINGLAFIIQNKQQMVEFFGE